MEYHKLTGVVRLSDSHYEASPETNSKLVGVPGTRYLEFMGTAEGSGVFHLVLGRPWEVTEAFRKGEVYEPVGSIRMNLTVKSKSTWRM